VTQSFNQDVLPNIAAQFGSAGRTGGGIHQQVVGNAGGELADSLSGLAANIYSPAYESERNRQLQAAQGAESADFSRTGLASGLYGQGLDRQLAGGQTLASLGLQGAGGVGDLYGNIAGQQFKAGTLAPSLSELQYGDANQLLRTGGIIEDQSQRLLDDDVNRFNFGQTQPLQNLQNYANFVNGINGGFGTTTASGGGGSRAAGVLGGALSGGSIGGPPGAVLGGLLSLL